MLGTRGDRDLVATMAIGPDVHRRPGAHTDRDKALPGSTGGDGCADHSDEAGGFSARDRVKDLEPVGNAAFSGAGEAAALVTMVRLSS